MAASANEDALRDMAERARAAAQELASAPLKQKNDALAALRNILGEL